MEITYEDSGTPLKRSRNRKGETSGEQLRRMCKNIADSITSQERVPGRRDHVRWRRPDDLGKYLYKRS